MTSLPEYPCSPPLPNLTLRTPHPGAFDPPRDQSHNSSVSHPVAPPLPPVFPLHVRVLSVWNALRGFELRTSQTTTAPSCDATANLLPLAENAVENEAGEQEDAKFNGSEQGGGRVRVVIGVKETHAPPERRCKYTFGESPTERRVQPSGESEAT